jgi:hypothetical protein
MTEKTRWLAMLCIASLFVAVGGCSDDDDPVQPRQVNQQQAESIVGDALGFLLEFGSDIADLIEAAGAGKAGDMSKQLECVPIPGLEREFFCDIATNGEICPGTSAMNTVWTFNNCTDESGGLVDGTVDLTESGNTFDLVFDLDVDGGSIIGFMQVSLGDPCVTITYTGLEIAEDDVVFSLDGNNTLCPSGASGNLNATVDASGFERFLMQISFVEGIPTVTIVSATTQVPLFSCTYNPLTQTATCVPIEEF